MVVGATGTIGSAVVRALVASGQPVVAVAPQAERLAELRRASPGKSITSLVGRVLDDAEAEQLADALRALERPLAGVVVAFPHGQSAAVDVDCGRLLDHTSDSLADCLAQTVLAQHALARHLIPVLAESGRNAHYVIVGGPGSETPWAGYGHRSVAMAATRMLARVLHDEVRATGVRVQLLSIDSPVRGELPSPHECPEWPAASDIARAVARMLDRTAHDESTEAVVTCTRGTGARPARRVARAYTDVPSFLASLRRNPNRITPQ